VIALVAVNLATFAYEAALGDTVLRDAFVDAAAVIPYDLTHGVQIPGAVPTVATLVTAQFLHASVPHVAFNMLFLAAFGPAVERIAGPVRFLAFYLACGVLGNLAQVSVDPASHVPEIGASGAIAGVLGAYIVRFPSEPLFWRVPAFVVIGLWAAAQFVHGFGTVSANVLSERGGGTAYFAHIGGFLAGVLSIALFTRARGRRRAAHIGEL
jgi:membrane associated rhomboid family serine protease